MADYRVISADTHVIETPDLWRSRIDPKYRDRCPRIVNIEGKDVWIVDNLIAGGAVIGQGARVGMRFDQRDELVKPVDSFDQVRLGAYDPHEALKDMDIDGIDVAVIYPTEGFALYHECRDSELLTASLSAYNGWLADFCSAHPKRLKGVGFINVDDVQTGIKEMERFAKLGLVGAHIPVYNSRLRYNSPVFEPLWAAAEDLDMSIALHINSNRPRRPRRVWAGRCGGRSPLLYQRRLLAQNVHSGHDLQRGVRPVPKAAAGSGGVRGCLGRSVPETDGLPV